ncbi:MAG: DUF3467 domain-containing protein [Planctomycetota bacterium]
MSDENTPNGGTGDAAAAAPEGAQAGVQVLFNESSINTTFANGYFISQSAEEVLIHLGFNMPNPNAQQQGQAQMLFKVTDRVVLSYTNAKRLAMSLTQLIKRHEQQFGEIAVMPQQAPRADA